MKKNVIITGAIVAVIIIAGVVTVAATHKSKSSSMDMSASSSSSMTNTIGIKNYMFTPMVTTVKVGTTVTWTNMDNVSHTITADTVSSDAPSSMDIANGKSYTFTFKKAGTYTYHCFPHPYMHGTVIVTN